MFGSILSRVNYNILSKILTLLLESDILNIFIMRNIYTHNISKLICC